MPLKLNSTGGGSVTVDVPNTASTFTATLPAKTGNIITSADTATVTQGMIASGVGGTGPAFSAYQSGTAQVIATATFTKVSLQSEEFDTNNNFDSTTNYRFTPTVAGYYQLNGAVSTGASAGTTICTIYKNGSEAKRGNRISNGTSFLSATTAALIYMNGSTDYVELYIYQDSGGNATMNYGGGSDSRVTVYFQGSLVRAA